MSEAEDVLSLIHLLLSSLASHEAADHVVANVRRAFGGGSVYINAPPNDRRHEALRLLGAGHSVGEVARRVNVHPATVYRWWRSREQRLANRESTGLARSKDWTL